MRHIVFQAVLWFLIVGLAPAGQALQIDHVGMVAPNIVGVTFHDGTVEHGRQSPYGPKAGDVIEEHHFPHRWLKRDGDLVGAIAGEQRDILFTFDKVHMGTFDTTWASEPLHYSLSSIDDQAYSSPQSPVAVYRKTKPNDMGRMSPTSFDASLEHTLYLHLQEPLTEGKSYALRFEGDRLAPQHFAYVASRLRSEAVHVSQIGFRPDDPAKVAFLSCWMGDGGGLAYAGGMPFMLVEETDGAVRYEGVTQLSMAANDHTEDAHQRNYNGTDVYLLDFSDFAESGLYRVVMPGVGCSYPFAIGENVWYEPFRTSARGFYHMRSGIALGPPYTDYVRPRCFHPDDGLSVYASTVTLLGTAGGPLGNKVERTNFSNLVKGKTESSLSDAWGGYMDAGDWDRRAQHLLASQLLLELAALFPAFFQECSLNIPESEDALPDIVNEALFNIDFYGRLQTTEGGIRGGVESEEHPRHGETSWQESLTVMAYAPGRWSSYQYAGTAARAAFWLEKHAPKQTGPYRQSALRAMAWAEAQHLEPSRESTTTRGFPWGRLVGGLLGITVLVAATRILLRYWRRWGYLGRAMLIPIYAGFVAATLFVCGAYVIGLGYTTEDAAEDTLRDARNYAAAELFRLTGETQWHDVFEATSAHVDPAAPLYRWQSHDQEHGAWVFSRTDRPGMNEALKGNCLNAIVAAADERVTTSDRTGFRWTKYPWRPFGMGIPSAPDAVVLLRAYVLTDDERYLRAAVLACQVGAGANPSNLCFTTGVGIISPQHPLHLDSRLTHQAPPPGLTVLGPRDVTSAAFADDWGRRLLKPHCYPELASWPPIESYMDVFWNSPLCEFTIHLPMAQNAYVWGFLAARP